MTEDRINDPWIPTRQTLLSRLKDWSDHDSWKEFFDVYWKLIYKSAIKSGLNDTEAQEVVQETIIFVCKSMPAFKYDPKSGTFKGWLLKQTSWRIHDQFRKRSQGLDGNHRNPVDVVSIESIGEVAAHSAGGLEGIWDEEWRENLIDAALQRIKQQVDARQYQLFDLYVIKKWPVSKISKSLNASRASIYLAKHRVSGLFARELKALESQYI